MAMYGSNVSADDYNVSLDGYQMIMETVTPNETFNRRETIRHNILGGTMSVMRGNYLARDYSFTTHLLIDPDHPDVYDDILKEWQSKPVEVISKYMGGKFDAEVIIKKIIDNYPSYIGIEVQVIEIPSKTSSIPNDEFIVPEDKVAKITTTSTKSKNKSSTKNTKNTKNTKQSAAKKALEEAKKKLNKKKGSNITKAKKNG